MIRSYSKVSQTKSEKTIQAHINPPLALLTQSQLFDVLGNAIDQWSENGGMVFNALRVNVRRNEVFVDLVKPKQEEAT